MKRGTFKISTNLFRFRDSAIIAKVFVRNDNKAILTKTLTIQQPITPETEVKKVLFTMTPKPNPLTIITAYLNRKLNDWPRPQPPKQ